MDELYFYPYDERAMEELENLRKIKNEFWENAPWFFETYGMLRRRLSFLKTWYKRYFMKI